MPDPMAVLRLARRAVAYELSLYVSLARWVLRRPSVPRDAEPVGYAQLVTPLMGLWIFASAVEVPVFHLLIPWDSVRTAGLVLGVWGLFWMLGLLASMRVHPHLLDGAGLRVRYGARIDIPVPWSLLRTATARTSDLSSSIRTLQSVGTDDGVDLHVGVGGSTNVQLVLAEPLMVSTPKGEVTMVAVSLFVDDPKAFVARVRRELSEHAVR